MVSVFITATERELKQIHCQHACVRTCAHITTLVILPSGGTKKSGVTQDAIRNARAFSLPSTPPSFCKVTAEVTSYHNPLVAGLGVSHCAAQRYTWRFRQLGSWTELPRGCLVEYGALLGSSGALTCSSLRCSAMALDKNMPNRIGQHPYRPKS